MKKLKISRPVLTLTLLWLVLQYDYAGFARIGLLAALLHECGHVIAWIVMTHTLPVLRFSVTGIGLDVSGTELGAGKMLLLAAAGPAANFLICMLTVTAMQYKAGYWGWLFAAANCLVGIFNLLPLGVLDGRQILHSLCILDLHLRRK